MIAYSVRLGDECKSQPPSPGVSHPEWQRRVSVKSLYILCCCWVQDLVGPNPPENWSANLFLQVFLESLGQTCFVFSKLATEPYFKKNGWFKPLAWDLSLGRGLLWCLCSEFIPSFPTLHRVSLWSSGFLGTHYIDQAHLGVRDLPPNILSF